MFFVRFWGVRGSIACPEKSTLKFGGNTSCLEIRADNKLVIVDFGTGVHALGNHLVQRGTKECPLNIDVFLSHTHLDHLAGFQVFAPFFIKSSTIHVRGPHQPNKESLTTLFNSYMSYRLWPVRLYDLPARITFEEINEMPIDLGGGLVCKPKYMNHPAVCLGYRFEYHGKSIVTAFDTEPFRNVFTDGLSGNANGDFFCMDAINSGSLTVHEENKKLIDFYRDADVLICDSQYTEKEYRNGKQYWGHSTFESSITMAKAANVKKLLLFHHDPGHHDDYLSALGKKYTAKYKPESGLQVIVSREGMTIEP